MKHISNFPKFTFIYDRFKKASPARKASIELRITYQYKQRYISTGIQIYPDQWCGGMVINTKDAQEDNKVLEALMSKVKQAVLEMANEGSIDITKLRDKLRREENKKINFLTYCKQRAEIRKYNKSKDSQQRYCRFIRLFTKYGKIKDFEDITEYNIIMYDKYLCSQGMKPYSKWNNYHRFLNSFILDAIDEGYISKNPYKWINIYKDKSNTGIGKYLTQEEFDKIKDAILPTESLNRIRDVFMFQVCTCLSYSDLKNFNADNIVSINGMKVYSGKRKKTQKVFTIPLASQALDILSKYNNNLPIISNVKYNMHLKALAQYAGVDKPISTHWARHTGATLLLNKGVSMQIISKVCGHSSTKITEQIYAKLLDETVVNAVSAVWS